MRTSKLVAMGSVLASYVWVLAGGCSSGAGRDSNGLSGGGPGQMMGGTKSDAAVVGSEPMGLGGSNGMHLHPLCGEATIDEQCLPDDPNACADFRPPVIKPPLGSGGEGGSASGGEGGGSSAAEGGAGGVGTAGESSGGTAGESGGASGGGAHAGASGEGGGAGHGSEPVGPASYGCQITRADNPTTRSCHLAGEGAINAPCFSSADCEAGLACVVDGQAGRCLQYCCGGDAVCATGSYCAGQQLRQPGSTNEGLEPPQVPVCVPADDCGLEEPFPCPPGTECRCQDNTACMVVRDDGTTTCRTPGVGQQGDACPCAWNHVCSSVTNKCVKICNTDPSKNDCGEQKCQASSELPQNFGVCVGPVK